MWTCCLTAHSLTFVVDKGELYTFGRGVKGQLGHSNTRNQLLPELVSFFAGKIVVSVSCGFHHTMAVTSFVTYCNGILS